MHIDMDVETCVDSADCHAALCTARALGDCGDKCELLRAVEAIPATKGSNLWRSTTPEEVNGLRELRGGLSHLEAPVP